MLGQRLEQVYLSMSKQLVSLNAAYDVNVPGDVALSLFSDMALWSMLLVKAFELACSSCSPLEIRLQQ